METKITFEEYLRKENLSENTITSYLWTVNYFNANYDAHGLKYSRKGHVYTYG